LKKLLAVSNYPSEADARQAVLDKKISVALTIPSNLTSSVIQENTSTALTFIYDPASTLSASIVQSIVESFVNGLNGSKIATQVVVSQLVKDGLKTDASLPAQVAQAYGNWSVTNVPDSKGVLPSVDLQAPTASAQGQSGVQSVAGVIMAGMIVYFVFYTGALNAQSIIREQDDQTLARLSVTPTSPATILLGKVIGSMILISVQIVVLMLLSSWFFRINWGNLIDIGAIGLVLVFLASGFGIFLMSFIKNMRQTGIVLGGVLTVLGMLGGLFTGGFQNLPKAFLVANLFTPHGWAMQAFKIALGETSGTLVIPLLVMAVIGVVSMAIGIMLFRRRFA
jgi:ABC-type multidrug transport system permease subunit